MKTAAVSLAITGLFCLIGQAQIDSVQSRVYDNQLRLIQQPKPLLADYPEFIAPVEEVTRYQSPVLVDEADADLHVRAWRFSYTSSFTSTVLTGKSRSAPRMISARAA